jgi:hypothetical protein
VIRAKVIDLPKEGLTAELLEGILNKFIETERPDKIVQFDFNSEFGLLTIVYEKD